MNQAPKPNTSAAGAPAPAANATIPTAAAARAVALEPAAAARAVAREAELALMDAELDELTPAPVTAPAPEPSPELQRLLQGDDFMASQPDMSQGAYGAPNRRERIVARTSTSTSTTTQEISLWAEEFTLGDPISDARRAASGPHLTDQDIIGPEPDPRQESAILNALDAAAAEPPRLNLWQRLKAYLPHRHHATSDPATALPAPLSEALPEPRPEPLPEPRPQPLPEPLPPFGADDPIAAGDEVLARQARAAALEDMSLSKSLGLKRSEVMLNGLRSHLSWALFSFGSLALAFVCLAALLAQSNRPALQPYVVTVDRHGVVLNRGLLTPASEALTPSLIAAELSDFVRNVRMVTPDKTMQRELMTNAYAMVAPGSKVFFDLDAYFNAHNPLSNRAPYAVSVDILNVIATGEHTVQIDWRECSHAGAADTTVKRPDDGYERTMRALISFKQDPTAKPKALSACSCSIRSALSSPNLSSPTSLSNWVAAHSSKRRLL